MTVLSPKDLAANALRVYQEGDFKNAAHLFADAAAAFQSLGNYLDAAEMKNNQSVALLQAGDAQGAFTAAHGTAEVFFAGQDFRRQGMAYGNEATALKASGRLDESARCYQLSADALEKAGEDQLRASVMQDLAVIQLRQGQVMKALLSLQLGVTGVKHPSLKQRIMRGLLRLRV